jgi:hypothetical protein
MPSEPLNTFPIQQFLQQVKAADTSNAKEVKLNMQQAKTLALTLGEVMTRLNGDLEKLLLKKNDNADEVIQVQIGSSSDWK